MPAVPALTRRRATPLKRVAPKGADALAVGNTPASSSTTARPTARGGTQSGSATTASISTRPPSGSAATPMAARAGSSVATSEKNDA